MVGPINLGEQQAVHVLAHIFSVGINEPIGIGKIVQPVSSVPPKKNLFFSNDFANEIVIVANFSKPRTTERGNLPCQILEYQEGLRQGMRQSGLEIFPMRRR